MLQILYVLLASKLYAVMGAVLVWTFFGSEAPGLDSRVPKRLSQDVHTHPPTPTHPHTHTQRERERERERLSENFTTKIPFC